MDLDKVEKNFIKELKENGFEVSGISTLPSGVWGVERGK